MDSFKAEGQTNGELQDEISVLVNKLKSLVGDFDTRPIFNRLIVNNETYARGLEVSTSASNSPKSPETILEAADLFPSNSLDSKIYRYSLGANRFSMNARMLSVGTLNYVNGNKLLRSSTRNSADIATLTASMSMKFSISKTEPESKVEMPNQGIFTEFLIMGIKESILVGTKQLELSSLQPTEITYIYPATTNDSTEKTTPLVANLHEYCFPHGAELKFVTKKDLLELGKGCCIIDDTSPNSIVNSSQVEGLSYQIMQYADASNVTYYATCVISTEPVNDDINMDRYTQQYKEYDEQTGEYKQKQKLSSLVLLEENLKKLQAFILAADTIKRSIAHYRFKKKTNINCIYIGNGIGSVNSKVISNSTSNVSNNTVIGANNKISKKTAHFDSASSLFASPSTKTKEEVTAKSGSSSSGVGLSSPYLASHTNSTATTTVLDNNNSSSHDSKHPASSSSSSSLFHSIRKAIGASIKPLKPHLHHHHHHHNDSHHHHHHSRPPRGGHHAESERDDGDGVSIQQQHNASNNITTNTAAPSLLQEGHVAAVQQTTTVTSLSPSKSTSNISPSTVNNTNNSNNNTTIHVRPRPTSRHSASAAITSTTTTAAEVSPSSSSSSSSWIVNNMRRLGSTKGIRNFYRRNNSNEGCSSSSSSTASEVATCGSNNNHQKKEDRHTYDSSSSSSNASSASLQRMLSDNNSINSITTVDLELVASPMTSPKTTTLEKYESGDSPVMKENKEELSIATASNSCSSIMNIVNQASSYSDDNERRNEAADDATTNSTSATTITSILSSSPSSSSYLRKSALNNAEGQAQRRSNRRSVRFAGDVDETQLTVEAKAVDVGGIQPTTMEATNICSSINSDKIITLPSNGDITLVTSDIESPSDFVNRDSASSFNNNNINTTITNTAAATSSFSLTSSRALPLLPSFQNSSQLIYADTDNSSGGSSNRSISTAPTTATNCFGKSTNNSCNSNTSNKINRVHSSSSSNRLSTMRKTDDAWYKLTKEQHVAIVTQKAYCIISDKPLHNLFFQVLEAIALKERSIALEKYAHHWKNNCSNNDHDNSSSSSSSSNNNSNSDIKSDSEINCTDESNITSSPLSLYSTSSSSVLLQQQQRIQLRSNFLTHVRYYDYQHLLTAMGIATTPTPTTGTTTTRNRNRSTSSSSSSCHSGSSMIIENNHTRANNHGRYSKKKKNSITMTTTTTTTTTTRNNNDNTNILLTFDLSKPSILTTATTSNPSNNNNNNTAYVAPGTLLISMKTPTLKEWTCAVLLSLIPSDLVVKIHSLLLQEQSLLVFGSDAGMVTAVATAFVLLLQPFTWEGIFVPLLPTAAYEALDAPVPFIIGIVASTRPNVPIAPCAGVLHLDDFIQHSDQYITSCFDDLVPRNTIVAPLATTTAATTTTTSSNNNHSTTGSNNNNNNNSNNLSAAATRMLNVFRATTGSFDEGSSSSSGAKNGTMNTTNSNSNNDNAVYCCGDSDNNSSSTNVTTSASALSSRSDHSNSNNNNSTTTTGTTSSLYNESCRTNNSNISNINNINSSNNNSFFSSFFFLPSSSNIANDNSTTAGVIAAASTETDSSLQQQQPQLKFFESPCSDEDVNEDSSSGGQQQQRSSSSHKLLLDPMLCTQLKNLHQFIAHHAKVISKCCMQAAAKRRRRTSTTTSSSNQTVYALNLQRKQHQQLSSSATTSSVYLIKAVLHDLNIEAMRSLGLIVDRLYCYNSSLCGEVLTQPGGWQQFGVVSNNSQQFEFLPELFMEPLRANLRFQESVIHTQLFVSFMDQQSLHYNSRAAQRSFLSDWLYFRMLRRRKWK